MRITQKELCVRYLASRGIGTWVQSHDIVKNASGKDHIISDADTRMYELIRDGGIFESAHNLYYLETRRIGKYAEFRISRKESRNKPTPSPYQQTKLTR